MKKKKKTIGSLLGSIFVEQVDVDEEEFDETESEMDEEVVEDSPAPRTAEAVDTEPEEVELNDDIVASIKKAIDDANLEGYDYYEFMQTIAKQNMPSEKEKYTTVFSVVSVMNVTKERLLSTASHYLDVLADHKARFIDNLKKEEAETVLALYDEADAIEDEITKKTEQIEAIKAEILEDSKRKEEIVALATNNESSLVNLNNQAQMAYKMFEDQITDSKAKIDKYINEQ